MSFVLLEFQGGEILSRGRGGPPLPPLNEALIEMLFVCFPCIFCIGMNCIQWWSLVRRSWMLTLPRRLTSRSWWNRTSNSEEVHVEFKLIRMFYCLLLCLYRNCFTEGEREISSQERGSSIPKGGFIVIVV